MAAGWLLVAAAGLGFLPLPSVLSAVVAPGLLDRFPGWSAHTASVNPEDTTEALTHLLLVLGTASAVGAWGIAHWRRRAVEWALLVLGGLLPIIALTHAWTNTTALFGIYPTWVRAPYKFFAPFLSHGHAGSALLLAWPLVLYEAANQELTVGTRAMYGALASIMAFAALMYGATAPLGVMGLMVVVLAFRQRWLPRVVLAAAAPFGALAVVGFDTWMDPGQTTSLHGRLGIWSSTVSLIGHHWLFGAGAGTFARALSPYRTDLHFELWDHAHQDYLEWVAETGLVGLLAAGIALLLVRPTTARDPNRAFVVTAGAAGVLLHGMVDFPLRLPALAMSVAALVAWRQVVHQERRPASPLALRAALTVLLCANVGSAAWQLRARAVEPASTLLWASKGGTDLAASTVRRWAPWRPELGIYEGRRLAVDGLRDEAVARLEEVVDGFPADPDAQRTAAGVLFGLGASDLALRAVDRAVEEAPWDWRTYVTRARVLTVTDRDRAAAAWHLAIEAGAPSSTFEEAWAVLPVGLYWVDAVQSGGTRQDAALAAFLLKKGDAEAAALAFEEAAFDDPNALHPGYVDALLTLDRLDQAERYLDRARSRRPGDPVWTRRLAVLREKQDRWKEASDIWMSISRYDSRAALRAVDAAAHGEQPQEGLRVILRMQADGIALDTDLILRRAQLQAKAGLRDECVRDLAASGLLDRRNTKARAQRAMQGCTARPKSP